VLCTHTPGLVTLHASTLHHCMISVPGTYWEADLGRSPVQVIGVCAAHAHPWRRHSVPLHCRISNCDEVAEPGKLSLLVCLLTNWCVIFMRAAPGGRAPSRTCKWQSSWNHTYTEIFGLRLFAILTYPGHEDTCCVHTRLAPPQCASPLPHLQMQQSC
jgi:hypothetical protein